MESTQQIVSAFLENYRPDIMSLCSEIHTNCMQRSDEKSNFDSTSILRKFMDIHGFGREESFTSALAASFSVTATPAKYYKQTAATIDVKPDDAGSHQPFHVGIIIDTIIRPFNTSHVEAGLGTALTLKTYFEEMDMIAKVTVLLIPNANNGAHLKLGKDTNFLRSMTILINPQNGVINTTQVASFCMLDVAVTYEGKELDVHLPPLYEGRNAGDAAVCCYSNVALLRCHLPPDWVINGMICGAGAVDGHIIPSKTSLKFWLQAPTSQELVKLQQRCSGCFDAARQSTGCSMTTYFGEHDFVNIWENYELTNVFLDAANELGILGFDESLPASIGPTIVGRMSQFVPVLNVVFSDNEDVGVDAFHVAEALALTSLTLALDELTQQKITTDFANARMANCSPIFQKRTPPSLRSPRLGSRSSPSTPPPLTERRSLPNTPRLAKRHISSGDKKGEI